MSAGDTERGVFSIVCAAMSADAAPGSAAALRAAAHLTERIGLALRESRLAADTVAHAGDAAVACFHNSSAALSFATALVRLPADDHGEPCRASVHLGAVEVHDVADDELAQRAPVRAGLQLMRAARPAQVLVSQLFYNIVSQFDHRCKDLLVPLGAAAGPQGRSARIFRVRISKAGLLEPGAVRRSPDEDTAFLSEDPLKRLRFFESVERILADEIGPMARVVVQRAAENVPTKVAFCQRVVAAVPDPLRREAMLQRLLADAGN